MAAFVMPVLSGLAGLFGGAPKTTKTSQDTTQQQQYNTTNTSTPNLSPFQQQLAGMFTKGAGDLWRQSVDMNPYSQVGMEKIGAQGDANRQAISNAIASRGLSWSPAASTALTQNTINTGQQQSNFLAGIPLLQRQLQQQSLEELMKAFGVLPTGVTQTGEGQSSGSSHMTGTNTTPNQMLPGLFSGIGASLPFAFPGLFGGGQQGVTGAMPSGYQQPSISQLGYK